MTKVFAYPAPVDLHKAYDGLAGLATTRLEYNVRDGALFLFVGRARTSCKILHRVGTGLCLFAKPLERGRSAALWPTPAGVAALSPMSTLSASELALYVEGCTLVGKQPLTTAALRF